MDLNWTAKPNASHYLFSAAGAAVGAAAAHYIPKIAERVSTARRIRRAVEEIPVTVVANVPGSPIDNFMNNKI